MNTLPPGSDGRVEVSTKPCDVRQRVPRRKISRRSSSRSSMSGKTATASSPTKSMVNLANNTPNTKLDTPSRIDDNLSDHQNLKKIKSRERLMIRHKSSHARLGSTIDDYDDNNLYRGKSKEPRDRDHHKNRKNEELDALSSSKELDDDNKQAKRNSTGGDSENSSKQRVSSRRRNSVSRTGLPQRQTSLRSTRDLSSTRKATMQTKLQRSKSGTTLDLSNNQQTVRSSPSKSRRSSVDRLKSSYNKQSSSSDDPTMLGNIMTRYGDAPPTTKMRRNNSISRPKSLQKQKSLGTWELSLQKSGHSNTTKFERTSSKRLNCPDEKASSRCSAESRKSAPTPKRRTSVGDGDCRSSNEESSLEEIEDDTMDTTITSLDNDEDEHLYVASFQLVNNNNSKKNLLDFSDHDGGEYSESELSFASSSTGTTSTTSSVKSKVKKKLGSLMTDFKRASLMTDFKSPSLSDFKRTVSRSGSTHHRFFNDSCESDELSLFDL